MNIGQLNGRGLSIKEIQGLIDTAVMRKDRPIQELLDDLERHYIRMAELLPGFSKRMLEVIKKHHPHLFNDMSS